MEGQDVTKDGLSLDHNLERSPKRQRLSSDDEKMESNRKPSPPDSSYSPETRKTTIPTSVGTQDDSIMRDSGLLPGLTATNTEGQMSQLDGGHNYGSALQKVKNHGDNTVSNDQVKDEISERMVQKEEEATDPRPILHKNIEIKNEDEVSGDAYEKDSLETQNPTHHSDRLVEIKSEEDETNESHTNNFRSLAHNEISTDVVAEPSNSAPTAPPSHTINEENVDLLRAQPIVENFNPHLDAIEASINGVSAGGPEWEVDSSPIESSSDSDTSSIESSSGESDEDEDEEDGEKYALLDPEEQARILMQDGGSDDEGGNKKAGQANGVGLRTQNEKVEEIVPKPNLSVTPDMKIEELGAVECIVETTVVIKAKTSGEFRVLDVGSVLCLENRTVIGVVADTIGRTQQPLYTVRFTNDTDITEAGLSKTGTPVYYVEQHSTFVFTQPLRSVKGSDASNFHDEEVGEDEIEFSDDEKEAEYKRHLKHQKQQSKQYHHSETPERGRGRGKRGRRGVGRSNLSREFLGNDSSMTGEINYDDVDMGNDDGYTPLQRPSDLQDMMKGREVPEDDYPLPRPASSEGPLHNQDSNRSRGDRFRRGRGRGFGDRVQGRGRGNHRDHSKPHHSHDANPSTYSNMGPPSLPSPTQPYPYHNGARYNGMNPSQSQMPNEYPQYPPYQPPNAPSLPPQSPGFSPFSPSPISPLPSQQFGNFPYQNQSPQRQYFSPQQQHPPMPQMPPPGSHINPAFFNGAWQGQQGGQYSAGAGNNEASFRQVQETLDALKRSQGSR
ncbi:MAG: hypothetical protein Q9227_001809 [Pyrenula ochraceoflavens]